MAGVFACLYLCRIVWVTIHKFHLKIIVRKSSMRIGIRVMCRCLLSSGKSRIHLMYVSFFYKFTFQVLSLARVDLCVLLLIYLFIIFYFKGTETIQRGKGQSFQQMMLENCNPHTLEWSWTIVLHHIKRLTQNASKTSM